MASESSESSLTDKLFKQHGWISLIVFPGIGWLIAGRPTQLAGVGEWIPVLIGLVVGLVVALSGAKTSSINWNPTDAMLRQFGWIALVGFPLLFWGLFSTRPTTFTEVGPWVPTLIGLAVGVACALAGMIRPKAVKPVFVGLSLITFPIGLVVSEVFLSVVFFALFTVVSIIFRIVHFDPMTRSLEPATASYWTPKAQPKDIRQYFQQY